MSILQRLLQKHTEKKLTLAFLGDSVTQGCFELYKNEKGKICTVTKPDHAFSQLLLARLRALYPAVPFRVVNAGISGDRAPNGAKRLARDVLSHRPDLMEYYVSLGADLELSGHAHGGQLIIPGVLNGLYAPYQGFFPKYAGGEYALDNTTMIVSRGLCKNDLPRVFNRPELVVVDIVPG